MNYLEIIKTSIYFFPVIAFLFTIPYLLGQYHKYGSVNKFRTLIIYSFILYLMTIYFLVILPLPSWKEVAQLTTERMRLIPFNFVADFLRETSLVITNPSTYLKALTEPCVYIVVFNIFMTIPFGMYLRYYFKCSLKKTVYLSFLLSLFFELTQLSGLYFIYPRSYRLFDIDDLILNTSGGILGYFLVGLFLKYLPSREVIDRVSLEKGTEVSGLRRLTLFFLDLFIYLFLTIILHFFIAFPYCNYIMLVIYYVLIPYFFHGQTLGGKFLKVRLDFHHQILRLFFRMVFYYLYYYQGIIWFILGISYLAQENLISAMAIAPLYFFILIFVILFYLVQMILIWKNKGIYYDSILKVTYKSTITVNVNETGGISKENG